MKYKLLFFFLFITGVIFAQNLQLHFDTRHSLYGNQLSSSNYLTATFEFFKPDKLGSTFMFVDFDFNHENGNIGLVYAEIARDFKVGDFPLMPHIEYNGGLGLVKGTDFGFSIPNAYLAGASYSFPAGNFFVNTYAAYKLNNFEKMSHDVQWTLVWESVFLCNRLSFNGFLDIYTENKDRSGAMSGKQIVFLSDPQIWYNLTSHFSVGSEVKLNYNFLGERLYVIPTLGVKWVL